MTRVLVAIPDHLCAQGQWSDIHGFPPSYYYGADNETSRFIGPAHVWCRQTLGYSPPLYWGSDTPTDDDDFLIFERSWFAYFERDQDALLFKMRWLDRSVPFSELVADESIDDLRNSSQTRINNHVRATLGQTQENPHAGTKRGPLRICGPTGGYQPNMSDADAATWRAKETGMKSGFPQVEIRKSFKSAQCLIIVNLGKGYKYKSYEPVKGPNSWGTPTRGINVHMSLNGPLQMTFKDVEEMQEAIQEAKDYLAALYPDDVQS